MHPRSKRFAILASITILTIAALAVFLVPTALASNTFSDVPDSHWAHDFITWLFDNGITSGFPDGTYRPNNNVTRAEIAVFLQQVAGAGPAGPVTDADKLDGLSATDFLGASDTVTASQGFDWFIAGSIPLAVAGTTIAETSITVPDNGHLLVLGAAATVGGTANSLNAIWIEVDTLVTCGIDPGFAPDNSVSGATAYSVGPPSFDVSSLAANGVAAVTAGTHTVRLCGAHSGGDGTALNGSIIAQFLADASVSTLAGESTTSGEKGPLD